jgi:putative transposase
VQLHQWIVELSWNYPRYGYRRIRALLDQEGWQVSRKRVQRIRRMEGLLVRPKPKKILRQGVSTGLPTQAVHRNHVWTWDFIFDPIDKGSTLKMLTMLDEYTRQCLAIRVEWNITSAHVVATLWQTIICYGIPQYIRSDSRSIIELDCTAAWAIRAQKCLF